MVALAATTGMATRVHVPTGMNIMIVLFTVNLFNDLMSQCTKI